MGRKNLNPYDTEKRVDGMGFTYGIGLGITFWAVVILVVWVIS